MEDLTSILERARMLTSAANQVAEQMTQQAEEYSAVVQARRADEEIQFQLKKNQNKSKPIAKNDVGTQKIIRGAVFNGSSLVTTYEDSRPFIPRDSSIVIDNARYKLAPKGEWSANRLELNEDFSGNTNLDVEISISITETIFKNSQKSGKKNNSIPISTSDICGAIEKLNDFNPLKLLSNRNSTDQTKIKKHSKLNSKNKLRSKDMLKPSSPAKQQSSLGSHNDWNMDSNIENTDYNDFSSKAVTTPPRSSIEAAQNLSDANTDSNDVTAVALHASPSPSVMLQEIENISPEVQLQQRVEMNKRMATRGQQKAVERVLMRQLRSDQVGNVGNVGSAISTENSLYTYKDNHRMAVQEGGSVISNRSRLCHLEEGELEARRRQAQQRVMMKAKEDEEQIRRELEVEELERQSVKKELEEKARKLQELTAQRVIEYKNVKKMNEAIEKQRLQYELEQKRIREIEMQDTAKLKRIQDRMVETEDRIKKQLQIQDEKRKQEELDVEKRLKQIAEERGRTRPKSDRCANRPFGGDDSSYGSGIPTLVHSNEYQTIVGSTEASLEKKSKRPPRQPKPPRHDPVPEVGGQESSVYSVNVAEKGLRNVSFLPQIRSSVSEKSERKSLLHENTVSRASKIVEAPSRVVSSSENVVKSVSDINTNGNKSGEAQPIGTIQRKIAPSSNGQKVVVDDDDDDDWLSEDSLHKNNVNEVKKYHFITDKKLVDDNVSYISALTGDEDLRGGFENVAHAPDNVNRRRKRKKKETWKMEPIPIRPFVQVPIVS